MSSCCFHHFSQEYLYKCHWCTLLREAGANHKAAPQQRNRCASGTWHVRKTRWKLKSPWHDWATALERSWEEPGFNVKLPMWFRFPTVWEITITQKKCKAWHTNSPSLTTGISNSMFSIICWGLLRQLRFTLVYVSLSLSLCLSSFSRQLKHTTNSLWWDSLMINEMSWTWNNLQNRHTN